MVGTPRLPRPPRLDHSPPAYPLTQRPRGPCSSDGLPSTTGRERGEHRAEPARDGGGPEALAEMCAHGYLKSLYNSDNYMWSSSDAKDFTYFESPLMNEGSFIYF